MQGQNILDIPIVDSKTGNNKQIKFIVGGVLIIVAIAYLIFASIQSTSTFFFTVDEFFEHQTEVIGQPVRVSGPVDIASVDYNSKDLILKFDIVGESQERLPVIFNGPKPDQMSEGALAIIEGTFDGNILNAHKLMLQCPSKYEGEDAEKNTIEIEAVP
ncbi:MAG: hypothetical protein B6242_02785 [Anaerolineaceae bacterium 4572_78]|nr:MAG: hypothetical protein B6242_02785 [Anaerolineaceae bacterium 4572_78]